MQFIERRAAQQGLRNVTAEILDAHDLAASTVYDAASCRFAVMYFADPIDALRRIRVALKPGGRFAAVVWTDPGQPLFATTFGAVARYVDLPSAPAGAPSAFRYSPAGMLADEFRQAGFVDVQEVTHCLAAHWPGDGASLWEFFVGALQTPLATLDDASRRRLDAEVVAALEARRDRDGIDLPMSVHLATGVAPS